MMHEAEDEPLFAERAAGVDIAKAGIEVTVRVPSQTRRGGRQQDTRSFRTARKDLLALADWLRVWGVAKIGMEPAGDYWKPVLFLPGVRGLRLRAVSRRAGQGAARAAETDKLDSAWLAKITERGALPGCFVPPDCLSAIPGSAPRMPP
jgi:hypothetical protein